MWAYMKSHEIAAIFWLVALTVAVVMHYERWKDRRALSEPLRMANKGRFLWQCVQFHGGGGAYTPTYMTRTEACEWCSKLGAVAYVDDSHKKIFYRART